MKKHPSLSNSNLSNQFFTLRTDARRDSLWAKLMGKNTELAVFPEQAPEKGLYKEFTGTQEIPVERIIGTFSKASNFDDQFRPVKSDLHDRWVEVFLSLENGGWDPIVVHKVGENYYVEDGHQRVSVARLLRMSCIQAKVWEYPVHAAKPAQRCQPARCSERSSAKAYALQ